MKGNNKYQNLDFVAEPSNKATMVVYRRMIQLDGTPSKQDFLLLTDNIVSTFVGLVFKDFSPFFESFNYKVDQLISAGMFLHWFQPNSLKIKHDDPAEPQVLTWEHLYVGFIACMIPLIIGIAVFFCECLAPKIRKCLTNLTVYILMRRFITSKAHLPH